MKEYSEIFNLSKFASFSDDLQNILFTLKLRSSYLCERTNDYDGDDAPSRALATLHNVLLSTNGSKLLFLMTRNILKDLVEEDPNQLGIKPTGSTTLNIALARAVSSGMMIKVKDSVSGDGGKSAEYVLGPLYWKHFGISKKDIIDTLEATERTQSIELFKKQLPSVMKRLKRVDTFRVINDGKESFFSKKLNKAILPKIEKQKKEVVEIKAEEPQINFYTPEIPDTPVSADSDHFVYTELPSEYKEPPIEPGAWERIQAIVRKTPEPHLADATNEVTKPTEVWGGSKKVLEMREEFRKNGKLKEPKPEFDACMLTPEKLRSMDRKRKEDIQKYNQSQRIPIPGETKEEFNKRLDELDRYDEGFAEFKEREGYTNYSRIKEDSGHDT